LGNFDGLHIAHRRLIEQTVQMSRENNIASAILTFSPHPKEYFFGRGPEQILPHHIKDKLLTQMGVDYLVILPFDAQMATMPPEKFVKEILIDRFHAQCIFAGYNYHFGNKQMGNVFLLQEMQQEYNIKVWVQNEIRINNISVSSTAVRDYIKEGKVHIAGALLGYYPLIEGSVVRGNKLGTSMGFPTANLDLQENLLVPKEGVYIGYVKFSGNLYKSLINVGTKPTIGAGFKKNIEAYMLDFKGDLYDKMIQVCFTERIRDEMKFDSLHDLMAQMHLDEQKARHQAFPTRSNIALFPESLY